jgi:hypothetical protein
MSMKGVVLRQKGKRLLAWKNGHAKREVAETAHVARHGVALIAAGVTFGW